MEEGYDLKDDKCYNYWLSLQDVTLKNTTVLSKVVTDYQPEVKNPATKLKASGAKLPTSDKYHKEMNEKIEKKKEEQNPKEERAEVRKREEKRAEVQKKKEEAQKKREEKTAVIQRELKDEYL